MPTPPPDTDVRKVLDMSFEWAAIVGPELWHLFARMWMLDHECGEAVARVFERRYCRPPCHDSEQRRRDLSA